MIVKICGMTSPTDANACAEAGANLLGFIFHPSSPRYVEPDLPAELLLTARKVGVFVKQSADEVLETMEAGDLELAQLHGDQNVEFCEDVGPECVIKVFWPERYETVEKLQAELERFEGSASMFLLDAGTSGGGHGRSLDFSKLQGLHSPRPWLLAGGLGPDNLEQAIKTCAGLENFVGVDLNSGLESAPGVKDPQLVRHALEICNQQRSPR